MKKVLLVLFILVAQGLFAATLTIDKTNFAPGEEIQVKFSAAGASVQSNAWIGIIPSNVPHGEEAVNDQHDLTYQYLKNQSTGSLTFNAPEKPGSYDFRFNDSDSNGKEIASVTFTVEAIKLEGSLKLAKTTFFPGEEIQVSFSAPAALPSNAWVGIIPSDIPHGSEPVNDQHDIQYRYLEKKPAGVLSFTAPGEAGAYDLRMHDTDSGGVEITSVSFQVSGAADAKAMAESLSKSGKIALYGITFDTNSASIKPASVASLKEIADLLKQNPDLKLRIEGHTDNTGNPAQNMELSRKRAESVKTYLVQNLQSDAGRLTTYGFGDTQPIARNDNDQGRAQNRRVELVKQ